MKTEIIIAMICCVGIAIAGCAINESSESLDIPVKMADGSIEYAKWESKIWQGLFLYWSKTKQIEKKTPFTTTTVGEMNQKTDPNGIEAAGTAIGNIGSTLIKP